MAATPPILPPHYLQTIVSYDIEGLGDTWVPALPHFDGDKWTFVPQNGVNYNGMVSYGGQGIGYASKRPTNPGLPQNRTSPLPRLQHYAPNNRPHVLHRLFPGIYVYRCLVDRPGNYMMSLRTGQPLRQVNNDDIPNMICSKESKMEFCEFLGTLVNEGYNFDDIMGRVFPLVPSSNQNLRAQMDEGHRRWRKKFGGFYHGFTTRNGGAPQWAWSVCWGNGGAGALTDAQIEANTILPVDVTSNGRFTFEWNQIIWQTTQYRCTEADRKILRALFRKIPGEIGPSFVVPKLTDFYSKTAWNNGAESWDKMAGFLNDPRCLRKFWIVQGGADVNPYYQRQNPPTPSIFRAIAGDLYFDRPSSIRSAAQSGRTQSHSAAPTDAMAQRSNDGMSTPGQFNYAQNALDPLITGPWNGFGIPPPGYARFGSMAGRVLPTQGGHINDQSHISAPAFPTEQSPAAATGVISSMIPSNQPGQALSRTCSEQGSPPHVEQGQAQDWIGEAHEELDRLEDGDRRLSLALADFGCGLLAEAMPTSDLPPTRNSVATAQYPFPLSAPHDDASLNARGNLVLDYHIESYNVADQAQTSQEWFDMGMETWQDVTNIDAGEATTERLHHVDTFNDVAAPISVELSSREGGEELDSSVHRTLVPNTVESGMSFSNGTSSAGPGTGSSSASYPAWDSPADSFNHIGASSPTTTISAMGGDLETLNTMTTGGPDDGLSSAVVLGVVNDFDDQDLMEWDRPGPYPQSFMNPAQDQEPNSGETYKDAQS